ncbi:ankyrin repeat and SAM domain-containing protein 4B [Ornithorhynchus anatinus]|uniref:Ankyrin repeat and sterile alpha motif domain containing 4B n=2 Tax=Ornithorhynchus anatinus TaxID=9258 RepID=F7CR93_ORNAN|nr:ankyrin repeat and SAM domain-containing protein 4B [Ornithorhynchus anatinus]
MSTRYHQAAVDGYLELLKEATKRDLNIADEDGMTPTLLAAYHGHLEALEVICSRGGNPDKCDIWGNTPLHHAAANGHIRCVSFLTKFGANIFALDNDFQTPLDSAASREKRECVILLDKAATEQNILNPKRVSRLKEQAQRNARKQVKEFGKTQEKHQNKMIKTYNKERGESLYKGSTASRLSSSDSSVFGTVTKGLKDTFSLKSKKNRNAGSQQDENTRSRDDKVGQRNVTEVFSEEEEEDSLSSDFRKKNHLSDDMEDYDPPGHKSIFHRPGMGNIVFRRNLAMGINSAQEDISTSTRDLGFKIPTELFQCQGAENNDEGDVEAEEEGDLPWDEVGVAWEEDEADITPLEVFLLSQDLGQFIPVFMREQIDLEALMLCSDEDLQSIQIHLGPRKKVLSAVNKRKQVLQQPGKMMDTSL